MVGKWGLLREQFLFCRQITSVEQIWKYITTAHSVGSLYSPELRVKGQQTAKGYNQSHKVYYDVCVIHWQIIRGLLRYWPKTCTQKEVRLVHVWIRCVMKFIDEFLHLSVQLLHVLFECKVRDNALRGGHYRGNNSRHSARSRARRGRPLNRSERKLFYDNDCIGECYPTYYMATY